MSAAKHLSLRTLMEIRADLFSNPAKVEERYPWLMDQIRAHCSVLTDQDYLRRLRLEFRIRSIERRISKLEDDAEVDPDQEIDR